MKKLLVILAVGLSSASAQTMYKLECIPVYDSVGNVYISRSVYDHIPTSQDSSEFYKACNQYIRQTDNALKNKRYEKKYTVKVAEIKIDKNGNISIKPTVRYKSEWYRCDDKTIKVGDSIIITRQDAVE